MASSLTELEAPRPGTGRTAVLPVADPLLPLWLLLGGLLCLVSIDFSTGAYFAASPLKSEPGKFLSAAEHFGTPYGQLLVLLSLAAVSGWRERRVPRIFLATAAAGLAANLFKLLIARARPRAFDFETGSLAEGFTQLLPLGGGGSGLQSLPSAHTASAFGFACLLTWMFPAGRPAFLVIALLTGLQRITTAAHFPSDVLFGGALGWSVGLIFLHWRPLEGAFTRYELGQTVSREEPSGTG